MSAITTQNPGLNKASASGRSRLVWENGLFSAEQQDFSSGHDGTLVTRDPASGRYKIIVPGTGEAIPSENPSGQAKLTGSVTEEMVADVDIKFEPEFITNFQWSFGFSGLSVDQAEIIARGTLTFDADVMYHFAKASNYTKKVPLKVFSKTYHAKYIIGGVPVWQDINFTLTAVLSAGSNSAIDAVAFANASSVVEFGVRYNTILNKWEPIPLSENHSTAVTANMSIKGGVTSEIRLIPNIEVEFYEEIAGNLSFEPFIAGNIQSQLVADADLLAGSFPPGIAELTAFESILKAECFVSATLSVLNKKIPLLEKRKVCETPSHTFFSLPTLGFPKTTANTNGSTSLSVAAKHGVKNSFNPQSGQWTLHPANAGILDVDPVAVEIKDGFLFKAIFRPNATTDSSTPVTVFFSGHGALGELGRQFAIVKISTDFPDINLKQGINDITNQTATAQFDFGAISANELSFPVTFTVENTGTVALSLNSVTVNNPEFVVGKPFITSLVPGGSADFTLSFKPTITGTHQGVVTILSDDPDESQYTFRVKGQIPTLTITKAGAGLGEVTSVPVGINCGEDCTENYIKNTVVTLTATPASGSSFSGWDGDSDCTDGLVNMATAQNCIAIFMSGSQAGVQKIVFSTNDGIYVIDADGSNQKQLSNIRCAGNPSWSPGGNKIAYRGCPSGNFLENEIFVMNADGSNKINLTNAPGEYQHHSWSPSGTMIAFTIQINGLSSELFFMNADGSNKKRWFPFGFMDGRYAPSWSPDGTKIAYVAWDGFLQKGVFNTYNNIEVISPNGENLELLTHYPFDVFSPAWSPDGSKISFESRVIEGRNVNKDIYVMDATGSNQKNLTDNGFKRTNQDASWSPDGTKIAYATTFDFAVINADGSNWKSLNINFPQPNFLFSNAGNLSWSPDGTKIAFTSRGMYVMNSDGSNVQKFTDLLANSLSWSP